jgi:hypothetical protein
MPTSSPFRLTRICERLLGRGSIKITSLPKVPVTTSALAPGLSASLRTIALPARPGKLEVWISKASCLVCATSVVSVALLLDTSVSLVVVVIVAVLEMLVPSAASLSTCTTSLNVALAPASSAAAAAVNVPRPPAGGVVSVNDGPEVCCTDTNVVLAGTTSASVTFWASLAPLLRSKIV